MKYDKKDSFEIRKIIIDTLVEIRKKSSLNFDININTEGRYGESIILSLPPEETKIKNLEGEKGENFTKVGARIVFHQIYSNGSEVSYQMSHIPGLSDEPRTELKDLAPREKVNREYIMAKVLAFLEEVVATEKKQNPGLSYKQ